jgi:dTMP kinase
MAFFISIEGPDGSGKTTAAKRLVKKLGEEGFDVFYTREPGGSDIAEQIRKVILDKKNTGMDDKTEVLLYAASRRQHLMDKILPAIKNNTTVICDRFIDSSLAYQGYARKIGIDEVLRINLFAIENFMPNFTIFFDITPEDALKRIKKNKREVDRLDAEELDFHNNVYQGYLHVISRFPERFKVIDASLDEDAVFENMYSIVKGLLNGSNQ